MRISDWSSDVCSSDLGSKGTRLMKKTIFPVGNIKSDILRRAAMFIDFPLLVIWFFNWRLVAFPLALLWTAIEAALGAAVERIRLDFRTAPQRLLAAAWTRLWIGATEETPSELCPNHRT